MKAVGSKPKVVPLDEVIEAALREQLKATTPGSKDRQEAVMTAIKWRAVQAKIQMPDEGIGFRDGPL